MLGEEWIELSTSLSLKLFKSHISTIKPSYIFYLFISRTKLEDGLTGRDHGSPKTQFLPLIDHPFKKKKERKKLN